MLSKRLRPELKRRRSCTHLDVGSEADKEETPPPSPRDKGQDATIFRAFLKACELGEVDTASILLRKDPTLAARSRKDGISALHAAAGKGRLRVVQLLLAAGADPLGCETSTASPLTMAAWCGSLPVVRALLDAGSEVDARNRHGDTPLHWAAQQGHLHIVEELVFRGANVNATSRTGDTPLICAVWQKHAHVAHYLLTHGANPYHLNTHRRTAESYADGDQLRTSLKTIGSPSSLSVLCLRSVRRNPPAFGQLEMLPMDLRERLVDIERRQRLAVQTPTPMECE